MNPSEGVGNLSEILGTVGKIRASQTKPVSPDEFPDMESDVFFRQFFQSPNPLNNRVFIISLY